MALNGLAPFGYAQHGGTRDCTLCHSEQPNSIRFRVDWAKGFFIHKSTLTSCSECHANERPLKTASGANHAATGECISCHSPTLTAIQSMTAADYQTMTTALWKNANGLPTTLVSDPASNVSVALQTPSYNANQEFTGWSASTQYLPMTMNHNAAVTGLNIQNCSQCHSNTNSYVGGRFHASLFNHASAAGSGDCTSCHSQSNWSAASWNAGFFHRTNNVPTTCSECHTPTRPVGLVGVSQFNHAANGTGNCAGCHTSTVTALASKTANSNSAASKLQFAD